MAAPLAPDTLAALITQLLPANAVLSNSASAIAVLAHAIHSSLGFRLVKAAPPPVTGPEETVSQQPSQQNKLASSWFERCAEDESFATSYRHEQSSLLFEVRIGRLGGRIVVNAVAVEVRMFAEVLSQEVVLT